MWRAALPAFGLAILSGLLIRLAYRPVDLSPIALVALVPLFWGLRRCRPAMAFWVGLAFAFTIALLGTAWFTVLDRFNPFIWLGVPFLALYIAVHYAVATCVIVFLGRRLPPWPALIASMMAWAAAEYYLAIGALGMPYGLAQSQGGWLALAQVASIGGMGLLSALLVGVNLSVMETIATIRAGYGQAGAAIRLGVMLLLVLAGHLYGTAVLSSIDERLQGEDVISLRVAMLQPNISQEEKFASYTAEDPRKRRELQDRLNLMQLEQIRSLERGAYDLIVTSETTFTQDYLDAEETFQRDFYGGAIMLELIDLARDLQAPIVLGGVDNVFATVDGEPTEKILEGIDANLDFHPGYRVYGGFWLLRPTDEGIRYSADYRKVRLMPFGETVPYLNIIPGFQEKIVQVGSFDAATPGWPVGMAVEQPDGRIGEVRIGPSICFEDQFPGLQRHFARRGANLFVNITNDAWFDGSAGPAWHAEMARWRSIETRIPMIRCTNSGITAVIGAGGRVLDEIPAMEKGILEATVLIEQEPGKTVYTRLGSWFSTLSLLATILLVVWQWRLASRGEKGAGPVA